MKMKNEFRKIVAVLLVAVMAMLGIMPAIKMPVQAASPLSDQLGLEFLLRGFNVFSGQELRNDTLTTGQIMQPGSSNTLRGHYDADHINRTTENTYTGRSTVDWGVSAGLNLSKSIGTELELGGLFKASAKSKFGMNVNASYKNSYDSMFFSLIVTHANSRNYINNINDPGTKNAIQENLNPQFKLDLEDPNISPTYIFNTYGTHFLTGYNAGGYLEKTTSTVNTATNIASDLKIAYEKSGGISGGGLGLKSAFDLETKISVSGQYNTGNYKTQSYSDIRGGVGGVSFSTDPVLNTSVINSWINSFVRTGANSNCYILRDDNLKLTGVWELLPVEPEFVNRYNQLVNAYITEFAKLDKDFLDEFLYKSISPPSAYTTVSDLRERTTALTGQLVSTPNYTLASNSSPINNVTDLRNALGGDASTAGKFYHLTQNINLTTAWVPINNFQGTLDGRGYKITNMYTNLDSDLVNAGLFGNLMQGNPTIKNLGIEIRTEGNMGIKARRSGIGLDNRDARAGGIVAYNNGANLRSCIQALAKERKRV